MDDGRVSDEWSSDALPDELEAGWRGWRAMLDQLAGTVGAMAVKSKRNRGGARGSGATAPYAGVRMTLVKL